MKNIKHVLICFFLSCFICQNSNSQTQKNKLFIGTNLSHILHKRAPAADIILGYALTDNFILRASGGPMINMHRTSNVPVFESFQEKLIQITKVKGWQAGLGVRQNMYVSKGHEYSVFGEIRSKLKNFENTINGDFKRKRYFERIPYSADIQIWDFQIALGQAWQAKRFRMEFLIGFGASKVNIDYKDIPEGATFHTNQVKEDKTRTLYEPGEPYEVYPTHLFTAEFTIGYLLF